MKAKINLRINSPLIELAHIIPDGVPIILTQIHVPCNYGSEHTGQLTESSGILVFAHLGGHEFVEGLHIIEIVQHLPSVATRKRRVAGYARVSTDSDEQFTSYEAQVDYYTRFIQSKTEWEFVRVYTDEGISGTNTKHREGFNNMIADALAGKIDLIVTKSVSRFARNTVDSLVTIRKLKENGVER